MLDLLSDPARIVRNARNMWGVVQQFIRRTDPYGGSAPAPAAAPAAVPSNPVLATASFEF